MKKYLPAFSLLEISIVLMVTGILMIGALKGKHLIDKARLYRLTQELQTYQIAVLRFYELFHALPGDFDQASTRIKADLTDGNNNGIIEGEGLNPASEAYQAWHHLKAANLIESPKPPSILGGGYITFRTNPRVDLPGIWLQVGGAHGAQNTKGIFTPRQAQILIEKLGSTQAIADHGADSMDCLLADGSLNTIIDKPTCILYVALNF